MARNSKIPSTEAEFMNMIRQKTLRSIIEKTGVKIQELWKQYVQEGFYDLYDPWIYQRQYAIMDAIIKTDVKPKGNGFSVEVYIDNSIMNKYHPSTSGGYDGTQVAEIIETVGMTLRNGVVRDPSYAYERSLDWLRNDWEKWLNSNLNI